MILSSNLPFFTSLVVRLCQTSVRVRIRIGSGAGRNGLIKSIVLSWLILSLCFWTHWSAVPPSGRTGQNDEVTAVLSLSRFFFSSAISKKHRGKGATNWSPTASIWLLCLQSNLLGLAHIGGSAWPMSAHSFPVSQHMCPNANPTRPAGGMADQLCGDQAPAADSTFHHPWPHYGNSCLSKVQVWKGVLDISCLPICFLKTLEKASDLWTST